MVTLFIQACIKILYLTCQSCSFYCGVLEVLNFSSGCYMYRLLMLLKFHMPENLTLGVTGFCLFFAPVSGHGLTLADYDSTLSHSLSD